MITSYDTTFHSSAPATDDDTAAAATDHDVGTLVHVHDNWLTEKTASNVPDISVDGQCGAE